MVRDDGRAACRVRQLDVAAPLGDLLEARCRNAASTSRARVRPHSDRDVDRGDDWRLADARLRSWLEALPSELVRVRPVLGIGLVGVLMASGELERVEGPLRDAERLLSSDPEWADTFTTAGSGNGADSEPPEMVVVDDEGYRRLPGTIELYRAAQAHARGDAAGTVRHARQAIDLSPDDDDLNRAAAAGFLGLASWAGGDLEAAERAYEACMAGLRRVGHDVDVLGSAIALADIRRAQGRLGEAMRTYERALQLVPAHGRSVPRGTADMYVGMSEVHLERNELPAARQHLRPGEELGEHLGLPQHRYRWRVAMARLLQAEGDLGRRTRFARRGGAPVRRK